MRIVRRIAIVGLVVFALWFASKPTAAQNGAGGMTRLVATTVSVLREWDTVVQQLERSGQLRPRLQRADVLVPGRSHERLDQYFKGVRVFGGDVARQTENGLTRSLFGVLHLNISIDTTPELSEDQARSFVAEHSGAQLPETLVPELVILPRDDHTYALAYRARVFSAAAPTVYFIDADSGEVLLEYSDLQTQSAVGSGTGVLGDTKKLSLLREGTMFRASDRLRPPSVLTFDMRGNLSRTISFLDGRTRLTQNDLAANANGSGWSDAAAVDAHAYAGWVYDYYFKRYGRRGLDNNDLAITSLVHPVNRQDIFSQPGSIIGLFYLNAAYVGDGIMLYGEGLPSNLTDNQGRRWNYLAGALDVVAHELTHGVTDYSSRLIYRNESGALNEAFSDIMAAGVEFFHQPAGTGVLQADYVLGEDVITPGGIRSLANPAAYGDPDHYSRRYTGSDDNGGVHTNSGIANHAFYLAIEGGVNRTSGLGAGGVGGANREQIEQVFYRAFTQLMPANANFATARAATIQAARDLYGSGSAAEGAVTQAWTAVGVQ